MHGDRIDRKGIQREVAGRAKVDLTKLNFGYRLVRSVVTCT